MFLQYTNTPWNERQYTASEHMNRCIASLLVILMITSILVTYRKPDAEAHSTVTVREYIKTGTVPDYDITVSITLAGTLNITRKRVGTRDVYGYVDKVIALGSHKHWYDYAYSAAIAATPVILGAWLRD